MEHGFLHVSNLDDITSSLQILELDHLFESYGSMLGCRSLYGTPCMTISFDSELL